MWAKTFENYHLSLHLDDKHDNRGVLLSASAIAKENLSEEMVEIVVRKMKKWNVTKLSIRNFKIDTLNENFMRVNLTVLDLNSSSLKSLPDSISLLKNLTSLHLDDNKLEEFPSSLGSLTNLIAISFSFNLIKRLDPLIFGSLYNLSWIQFECNLIDEPPIFLTLLPNLKRVWITGNPFVERFFPEIFFHGLYYYDLTGLQKINLIKEHLTICSIVSTLPLPISEEIIPNLSLI